MATVKQCDRCGFAYPVDGGGYVSLRCGMAVGLLSMELCPRCAAELAEWAAGRPRIERYGAEGATR